MCSVENREISFQIGGGKPTFPILGCHRDSSHLHDIHSHIISQYSEGFSFYRHLQLLITILSSLISKENVFQKKISEIQKKHISNSLFFTGTFPLSLHSNLNFHCRSFDYLRTERDDRERRQSELEEI